MKVHELNAFLFSELWSYLSFGVDPFHGDHVNYFEQLDNAQDMALDEGVTNTIYVDKVSKDNLKIMNQAKETFQKEYNIDNLEWDTKK